MRKLALSILVLGLAVPLCVTARAAGGPGDAAPPPAADKPAAASSTSLPEAPKPAATATAAAPATAPAPATAATPALESELAELRALLHAQAAEIEAQRHELAEMKAKLAAPSATPAPAGIAVTGPVPPEDRVEGSGSPIGSYVDAAPPQEKKESPLALHFKGITLTPGGFTAAETAFRSRGLSADVNTPLTAIPYPSTAESRISEFNFSGRQSRISMLMDGKISNAKIGGYYEADFLSSAITSNNNQSNSYALRQRQFWGQARLDSGWIFTGGQMWSLATETRKGMDNRTEATPLTIDAQYSVGFTWARQYGFRVVKDFGDKVWLGASVEGSQTLFAAHGNLNNFIFQAPGTGGGLFNATNNYTLNQTPDFIFKAVFEPGWGHYELFGIVRTFRDRQYPCALATVAVPCPVDSTITAPSTLHATNDTRAGGGIGGGFRVPVFNKKLDVGLKGLYGDGTGRYGSATLKDVTWRPNGTFAPIHNAQGLATLEWHTTPKLDFYFNAGIEYDGRTFYHLGAGTVGYGSPLFNNSGCEAPLETLPGAGGTAPGLPVTPANCAGDIRTIDEFTLGFWHRIYKGDRGTVQWGLQYSYLTFYAWSGTTAVPSAAAQFKPTTQDNMFFTSFRYYLP
jgi:hypothetical protein